MTKYEIMFIVKATMEKEEVSKTAEAMKNIITDGKGKVLEFKELGEKKFAYPIKKEKNGYYFLMQVEASSEVEAEFNRKALLDENVLRHLIIKLDEE
jgi:small subunit ribosomal protein S6